MIKWFDSSLMTGLPVMTNTKGDLVTMLNALLVNGVNSKPVATVAYVDLILKSLFASVAWLEFWISTTLFKIKP